MGAILICCLILFGPYIIGTIIEKTITEPLSEKRRIAEEQRRIIEEKRKLVEEEKNQKIAKYDKLLKEAEIIKDQARKIRDQAIKNAEKIKAQAQEIQNQAKQDRDATYEEMDRYITEKCSMYPHLAGLMADLKTAHYARSADYLINKDRPALKEASRISELQEETKKIIEKNKYLEYKIAYIERLFPEINDIFDRNYNKDDLRLLIADRKQRAKEAEIKLDQLLEKKAQAYPYLAAAIADFRTMHYEKTAMALETKTPPAPVAALEVRELRAKMREEIEKNKVFEYKLAYLEQFHPNIRDLFDDVFEMMEDDHAKFELETMENTDFVRFYLSHEEYRSLSVTEKNQLALDRYVESRKSKWQIGRDYEMYIGYRYENEGFSVQYTGIIKNLEDMGRDLIAEKDNKVYIIQCKNWSKEKLIHEKHIFQLFGSVVAYNIEHNSKAKGVFVTTTELSPMAQRVAKELNIHVSYIAMGDFPRIKCNINRTSGEKIYHLPFDQQYDRVIVEKKNGECFVFTVKEAEDLGFRRAMKHLQ